MYDIRGVYPGETIDERLADGLKFFGFEHHGFDAPRDMQNQNFVFAVGATFVERV